MIYSSWDIECDRQKLVIMGHFLSFNLSPRENPKNQNFEKNENKLLEISSSYTCTKKKNMRYGSWDMEWDRQNFLSFWDSFWSFTSLTTQKTKMLKKMKKASGDITILQMYTINDNYDVWLLKYEVWQT